MTNMVLVKQFTVFLVGNVTCFYSHKMNSSNGESTKVASFYRVVEAARVKGINCVFK